MVDRRKISRLQIALLVICAIALAIVIAFASQELQSVVDTAERLLSTGKFKKEE